MTTPATIIEAIDTNAKGPASATVGGDTVTSKDISQLIEADRYVKANTAASTSPQFGLRFLSMKPPGSG